GSGAMGVAVTAALLEARGETRSKDEIALLANDIERTDFGASGGSQDSYGAAMGGAKKIVYHEGGGSECDILSISTETRRALEDHMLLIHTGDVHLSGSIHDDIKASYAKENSPTVRAMDELKAAAITAAGALEDGDLDRFIEAMNASRLNHYALHESCDSPTLRRYFGELEADILGGKACGAGGGGFIMIYTRPGRRARCIETAEEMGGIVGPLRIDDEGVRIGREPTAPGFERDALWAKCSPV
ncbi:MAG: hypothetical protein AAF492_18575, partial [Verrucomicrobiota bacterium]